jgi:putative nucleotide binding protein
MPYQPNKKYEEYAYILDFLKQGKLDMRRQVYTRDPVAQAIGEDFFTLLELTPKKGVTFQQGERVFIGVGNRDKIDHVKRRIEHEELTATAKTEIKYIVEKIVNNNEEYFSNFFNESRPLTTRMHQLELLPGIGKKLMWEILEERKKSLFKNFEDVINRVRLNDPKKIIIKRILMELEKEDKYQIFTRS